MKKSTQKNCLLILLVGLIFLGLPVMTRAQGGIFFPNTGPASTVIAGQPFSYMEPGGGDWTGLTTDVAVVAGVTHARPAPTSTLPRGITIITSRTSTDLAMVFTIDDSTRTKPDMTPLDIGDKIVIQIDPNNSRTATLSLGASNPAVANDQTTDYRFEIVINNGTLGARGFKMPRMVGTQKLWGLTLNPVTGTTPFAQLALLSAPTRYQVTVTIPLSLIGNPTTDIGLAFAVINDLGHMATDAIGNNVAPDVTGSEFPLSMGLDTLVNDLGLVDPSVTDASGSWITPARWGTGFFSVTPQDVTFTNSPNFYWSDSIKISTCNAPDWASVPASGVNLNQLALGATWYRYNENGPCKMRIWFNAFKSMPGAVKRRFLIVWGRPGISPQDWRVVTLTDPVLLTLPDEKGSFLWVNVPAVVFSDHPCLRIYILPETLRTDIDETFIRNITTQAQLDQMETAYTFQPNGADSHSAQMNFTATVPGTSCLTGSPCACLDQPKRLDASIGESSQFIRASYNESAGPIIDAPTEPQTAARDSGRIRVTVEAYGVPSAGSGRKPYFYLEPLGGIGWSIDDADLIRQQRMELRFDISNPSLLQRDFSGATPVDIKSPRRDIFLVIDVKTTQGTPLPTIVSLPPNPTLDPGETIKGVITIVPGGGTPPNTAFKRWGLSLHAGANFPHGSFSTFSSGLSFTADLEYRINQNFSIEGLYGFNRFKPGLNLHNLSANGKFYFGSASTRPFFNAGVGAYVFNSGTVHAGANLGAGLQFNVNPNFAVEAAYNFHEVFTSGSHPRFSTLQGGVRFRF